MVSDGLDNGVWVSCDLSSGEYNHPKAVVRKILRILTLYSRGDHVLVGRIHSKISREMFHKECKFQNDDSCYLVEGVYG